MEAAQKPVGAALGIVMAGSFTGLPLARHSRGNAKMNL
jgi:hypothetical protein